MADRELSQSELARRAGVTQATIYKLVSGTSHGSRHLHKIARLLGTTTAYLEGETDDPLADAPDAPFIAPDEQDLLDCYRVMTPPDRKALMRLACSLGGRFAKPTTFHAPGQEFHHEGAKG